MNSLQTNEGDLENFSSNNVLAICQFKDKLGIALYNDIENNIYVTEIHAFSADMEGTIQGLKLVTNPSLILTSLGVLSNTPLFDLLLKSTIDEEEGKFPSKILKRTFWDYDSCVRKICRHLYIQDLEISGSLTGENKPSNKNDRYNQISSVLNFEAKEMIRSLGALVSHLQTSVFTLDQDSHVKVNEIKEIQWNSYMRVDAMTVRSLQIFSEEHHPNVLRGKGKSKEGFSLYSYLDRTNSAIGRKCLKEWMLKPILDIAVLSERQNGIALMMEPGHSELISTINSVMKKINDLPYVLLRIKKVCAKFSDWTKLYSSLQASLQVQELISHLQSNLNPDHVALSFITNAVEGCKAVAMKQCLALLGTAIDFEATKIEEEIVICSGYNQQLDYLKATFEDLQTILRSVGEMVLQETPLLKELSVEYVPQIGFFTVVNAESKDFVPEHFEFMFQQDSSIFYKNSRMHELDDNIGDIQATISDLQASIVREIEDQLLQFELDLQQAATTIGEVDAIIALASVAADNCFQRPVLVEEGIIIIKDGRHPLQELTVDSFIPNDTYIVPGRTTALITGPNFSGKSVYIKQVGILVFMAHIGSYIPCTKAAIGITDRIFTRVLTVESCSVPQSTFTIDLNQMGNMIRHSTSRSLLLIDEFGKGTSPVDGIALLTSTLKYLTARKKAKVLCSTHFLEIFSHKFIDPENPDDGIGLFVMTTHIPDSSMNEDLAEAGNDSCRVSLFKVAPGISSSSNGISCTKRAGMPQDVHRRSLYVLKCFREGTPINESIVNDENNVNSLKQSNVKNMLQTFNLVSKWSNATNDQLERIQKMIKM